MGSAGKIATEEEKGTCEMLIELHPPIEVGKKEHLYLSAEARQQCEMWRNCYTGE